MNPPNQYELPLAPSYAAALPRREAVTAGALARLRLADQLDPNEDSDLAPPPVADRQEGRKP